MMKYFRVGAILVMLLISSSFFDLDIETEPLPRRTDPPFLNASEKWVDSVFNSMTPDERLGQLFMIATYSNLSKKHTDDVSFLIKEYNIGGLIFMQGNPERQISLTNYYQSISKTPLLIAMDAEWGPSQRLDTLDKLPYQMMMGAIQNSNLIYQYGVEVARQLKLLGVHVNFAPVLDINNNAGNPVISARSFGENKEKVLKHGFAYMSGLQDNKIIAVGKHFPGHGDTDSDSHKTLPIINHPWKRIDTLELFPFKELIKKGIGGMMAAHLYIPALDSTENLASSLSRKIVTDLLTDELGFKGLIFTDALNMSGVAKYFEPGEVDAKALVAGNDILLFSASIPKALEKIKEAISSGEISQKTINKKVKKILKAKYWVGLNEYKKVDNKNIVSILNNTNLELLNRKLIESSLTLIKNDNEIIPFKAIDSKEIVTVNVWDGINNTFQETLNLYDSLTHISIPKDAPESRFEAITEVLAEKDIVIVSLHSRKRSVTGSFDIPQTVFNFLEELSTRTNVVLSVFANPYCLKRFTNLESVKAILVAYEDNDLIQELSAQLLYGGIPSKGILPVSVHKDFPAGTGIIMDKPNRLKYSIPEELGIDSDWLYKIDSIAEDAIKEGAFPGCQMLFAKNGVVFYRKSFGHFTYSKERPVENSDLYDIASITKIVSSVASLMKLHEQGKFSLDDKISKYLPYLDTTNKKDIVIKEILTHQSQLAAWIPFWVKTVRDTAAYRALYSNKKTEKCQIQVSDRLYISSSYRDSIYKRICISDLRAKKEYKYSDVGYYLFHQMIEKLTDKKLDEYVSDNFYNPLGATTLGYLPLNRFDKKNIAPTEDDVEYRMEMIQGHVHDPGAAMLGGVAGHAGVFSNSNDLAKMMQMYLNKGTYGGKRYLKDTTINLFTSCPYCNKDNRRGLGFDKPQMDYDKVGPTCECISGMSFGHSGFTGALAWADPDEQVVFIFLSNRIHPDATNKKLIKMDVRTKIMEELYTAIKKASKE